MMKPFSLVCLAALTIVGCSLQRPLAMGPVTPPREAAPAAPIPEGLGRASVSIRWPERRLVQAIPYATVQAHLEAFDAEGALLATTSIRRAGDAAVGEASLDLPVGSGRYLEVRLDSETDESISAGRSETFSVMRNQTVPVSVVLEPLVRTRFGPINAYSISGGTSPVPGLGRIWSVSVGPDDTLYLADFSNHAVRAVSADGKSRVVVGQVTDTATQSQGVASTVSPDNSGEGGLAEAATLRTPHGVYAAPDGDLFIADTLMTSPAQVRIRYVPATSGERFGAAREAGHIYTLLTVSSAFGAIGMVRDQDGALVFTMQNRNEIWRMTEAGTASLMIGGGSSAADGALPGGASLAAPWGLAMDAQGNLLFSEYQASRVRMLCRVPGAYYGVAGMEAGKIYTVLDGLSIKSQFGLASAPYTRQIALDRRSHLLVVDNRSHAVFRADRTTGALARLAGGLQTSTTMPVVEGARAASASFNSPQGLAIDSQDRLFIGDTLNGRVRWLHL